MEWLNYHHLLYFWTVARTGSIANASKELLLAPPTISAQVSRLEHTLGERLFARSGRRLVLTEAGRVVFRYAEDIFGLGRELMDTLKDRPTGRPLRVQPQTLAWLRRYGLRWDLLVMRDYGDYSAAREFKRETVHDLRAAGFDLRLAFEDDRRNLQMFHAEGVPCIYIHSGYYD